MVGGVRCPSSRPTTAARPAQSDSPIHVRAASTSARFVVHLVVARRPRDGEGATSPATSKWRGHLTGNPYEAHGAAPEQSPDPDAVTDRGVAVGRGIGLRRAAATRAATAGGAAALAQGARGISACRAAATRWRSATTTTCRTAFYEMVLGPSMTYTCAVLPERRLDPRAGPGRQVRPGRPQARSAVRACGCSMSGAAGAGWCVTPPVSTAST